MKRWILTAPCVGAVLLASFHLVSKSHGQAADTTYPSLSIARWQHNAAAAISFTFDDGLQCHRDKAMPLLDEFGFKGTFFVIAGEMREHRSDAPIHVARFQMGEAGLSWDEVEELHADGQEIGNHSLSHLFLGHIFDRTVLEREINAPIDIILAHVGQAPLTFAYPYSDITPLCREVVMEHHIAAREHWSVYGGPNFTTAQANGFVMQAIAKNFWLVPMIHGIDTGYLPLPSKVFHDHLAFIHQHLPQLWVDTFADVARYQQERQSARLQVLDAQSDETEFELNTPLASGIYNIPLTVVVPLPAHSTVEDVEARRGDQPVACTRESDRILVDVRPGTAPVTVEWN